MREHFEEAALAAGLAVMRHFGDCAAVQTKVDRSPVTQADYDGEQTIIGILKQRFPEIPIISEEAGFPAGDITSGMNEYFLVDALDGTKEFLSGRTDFTVNIAFICDGHPTAGVVYAPARSVMYSADRATASRAKIADHKTITSRDLIVARPLRTPPTIVVSKSHRTPETDEFVRRYDNPNTLSVGSSLKLCLVAEGQADLYPRFGRTMQWDIAAGHAVLAAAGGSVRTVWGANYRYATPHSLDPESLANPWFIAQGAGTQG